MENAAMQIVAFLYFYIMPGLISKLNSVFSTFDLVEATAIALEQNHELIVELNKAQLNQGELSDQSFLPPYKNVTKKIRAEYGLQTDVMDLSFTGSFQSRFYLSLSGKQYSILSDDSKTDLLIKRYSEKIFGLIPENRLAAWNQFLQPSVRQQLINKLRS